MSALLRHRWLAVGLLLLLVGAALPGVQRAAVPDNALTVWFLESDPQLAAYKEFQSRFGNDEVILLMVEPPEGVFHPAALKRLRSLADRIEALQGVANVHSILTANDAFESPDGLDFRPVLPRPPPEDPAALAQVAARTRAHPLFSGRLVSPDGKRAMLLVEMAVMADIDARRDSIVTEVRAAAAAELGEQPHAMGGIGVIYSGLNLITQRDFGIFVSLGYLIMFGLLWWVFRSLKLVAAAIGVITVGTLAALGAYGWMGHRLNMVTVVLPTLVVVLGVADAVHFPAAFLARARAGGDRHLMVADTLRRVWLPCLLTTVTTMAGFMALSSSPMAVIRHLGIYAAVGVGAALVASVVLMNAAFFALPERFIAEGLPEHPRLERALLAVRGALHTRGPVLAAGVLALAAVAGWGASRVVADTYTLGYLPDDHPVVRDHETITERWGAYSLLDFLVRPAGDRKVDDPDIVRGLERFVRAARQLDAVHDGFSVADIYRRMAAVFGGKALAAPDAPPLTPEQVEQLTLVLGSQGLEWDPSRPGHRDNILAPFATRDRALGRLTLVGDMMSAQQLSTLLDQLKVLAAESMGDAATLEPAGYPPLYVKIIDYVMSSQIRGFYIALGAIFLIMLVGLRSPRLALISLLPNIFPVVVMMGVMGALGIHLDVATATVAAIVLGVSIDDTVHFLYHWQRAEQDGADWAGALERTFHHAGVPAVITTVLLVLSYPVLMLAEVRTVIAFGLLTTVAAAAALIADLVLLPLLLRLWPARR